MVQQAQAHFIWLDIKPAGDKSQAQLLFGESPEASEAHLISKVAHTKVWVRGTDGKTAELKLAKEGDAALASSLPQTTASSVEAACDYGIYRNVLLYYYAKTLTNDWTKQQALARATGLKLDIVPTMVDGKLAVQVLFEGQPVTDAEVIIVDPAGEQNDLKSDAEGRASLKVAPGQHTVRAARIVADQSGEKDGKKYGQVWHYATLVLDVPADAAGLAAKEAKAAESDPQALDALVRARNGRSMWEEFPGFTADLTIHADSQDVKAKVEINADGNVSLTMEKGVLADWVEEQLNSLVQHRMPDGEVTQNAVTFSDQDMTHPLGRKIDLGDPDLQSAYRLKDDAIMEVNRVMGPMRFTISVMEIERNAENKYLPRSFTMNFFDGKSGELRTSLAYWNAWQRIGKFDLPKTILEINASKGGSSTKVIDFSNVQLVAKK